MKEQENNANAGPVREKKAKRSTPEVRTAQRGRPRTQKPAAKPAANTKPRKNTPKATPVKIYPLGGLGEIGKNLTVYECAGDMMIVDCGSRFPDFNQPAQHL